MASDQTLAYSAVKGFASPEIMATNIRSISYGGGYQVARKSKRRAWTSEQVRTLKVLAKKERRAASIARALKRTEGATLQKAFSIGVSLTLRG